jgi:hypothetical protein
MWLGPFTQDIPHPQEDFGAKNSYPVQIARALGYEPCNHAIGGGSNDAIFRIWTEVCDHLNQSNIVIACWTGCHRSEFWHEKSALWLQISPGTQSYLKRVQDPLFLEGRTISEVVVEQDNIIEFGKLWHTFANDQISASNNKLKNILALNASAERLGIRVINFDSFDPVNNKSVKQFEWPVDIDFMKFVDSCGYDHTDWGHYFLDAHNAYAKKVLESLHG